MFLSLIFYLFSAQATPLLHDQPHSNPSVAYDWANVILEATAREVDKVGARPTIISRQMAIAFTAMFDSWSAYDSSATPHYLSQNEKKPKIEHLQANKERAIAWAASQILLNLYPDDKLWISEQMKLRKLNPVLKIEKGSPEEIAQKSVEAIIRARRNDGANQYGSEKGIQGVPYSDYTSYKPINTPQKVIDPDRWQPLPFKKADGSSFYPNFLTPFWGRVKTFGLEKNSQFRPPPPPLYKDQKLKQEVDEVIQYNSKLSHREKAVVEFMRDGPRSTGQSGHWLRFAMDVSRRDKYNLDQDVKIFFAVTITAFDTFIAAWEAKRFYDSSRPWTLIREYYKGKKIQGWLGPNRGFGEINASEWLPYSPAIFITPPFPGYPSGHSAVSGACAKMLKLFTGSDTFGFKDIRTPGVLTEEDLICDGKPCSVELDLPTFTATAEMAGISRIMGGYHIQSDNIHGLDMGRKIARHIWPKIKAHF
jgi:hypothetical protein